MSNKMMGFKKIFSNVICGSVILAMLASCANQTWSVKSDDQTLSAGSYIYYLSKAYSKAYSKVSDPSDDILKQSIGGLNSSEWMKNEALKSCKNWLAIDKRMKEMGITLTDEEISKAESSTKSLWGQYGKVYEGFGISKDSFHQAESLGTAKENKLFNAIYGKDGTQAVSDTDIQKYYEEFYVSYNYFKKQYKEVTSSGIETVVGNQDADSSESTVTTQKQFDKYAESIKAGNPFDDVLEQYMASEGITDDPTVNNVENIDKNTLLPSDVKSCIKGTNENVASVVKSSDGYFYFIYKNSIKASVNELSSSAQRSAVLAEMKEDEFNKTLEDLINTMNIKVNNSIISKYQPSLFKND